jgi:NADH-quinone oxidoreductase subunit N
MGIQILAPEIVLIAFGIGLLLLELASPRSELLGSLAILSVAVAATLSNSMAGESSSAFGGMIVVDDFAIVFKFIMLFTTGMVALASVSYSRHFAAFQGEYYALLLFACAGMMLMASAAEWVTVYVALELTGVAIYSLSGLLKNRESSEAGIKFLLMGALSSAVLLYGIVFFFGLTGTTYLDQTGALLMQGFRENRMPVIVGTVLLVAGFGFKLATVESAAKYYRKT